MALKFMSPMARSRSTSMPRFCPALWKPFGAGPLEAVTGQRPGRIQAVTADVADPAHLQETIARVDFRDKFGPVDVGQGYMMDHIQSLNAASLWDKYTAKRAPTR
mgnify:CR=1 FL=1